MNFLADEGIDKQIVDVLRKEGYVVDYVAEIEPSISDDIVLAMANEKGAILLTADKDFGELVFRKRQISAGVILIRLAGLSLTKKTDVAVSIIKKHINELKNAFSVITPMGVRIRHQKDWNN